jgi:hypothetical protein
MRAVLLALVTVAVAAGCSIGSGGSATGGSIVSTKSDVGARALARYGGHGVAFDYPAAWGRYQRAGFFTTMTSPIVDMSTQPMVNPCTHAGHRTTCGIPVRRMHARGVVVTWQTWGGLGVLMHRRPASVSFKVLPGGCRDIGGDEIITAQVTARHHRVFLANACLRGPGIAVNERAFRRTARSAVATT